MTFFDEFEKRKSEEFRSAIISILNHWQSGNGAASLWPANISSATRSMEGERTGVTNFSSPMIGDQTVMSKITTPARVEIENEIAGKKQEIGKSTSALERDCLRLDLIRLEEMRKAFAIDLCSFADGQFSWSARYESIAPFKAIINELGMPLKGVTTVKTSTPTQKKNEPIST
ncbi:hypothetical protein OAN24_05900, partial [Pseudodesulfovibrio sp.]|nr:hypothetical protein [Pseudodesulfovibrio sp.]